jgi:tetratricopeptide (TPR) repeat protein
MRMQKILIFFAPSLALQNGSGGISLHKRNTEKKETTNAKRWSFIFCLLVFLFFGLPRTQAAQDVRKELSLHYYRGVVNFEAGSFENALAEFQMVSSIDPYYRGTPQYIQKCVKTLEQGRREMLSSGSESASQKEGLDYYFLGKSFYEKGDYRKALEAFKAVLAKNPNDKFALYYAQLCKDALPGGRAAQKGKGVLNKEEGNNAVALEKEVSYVKNDIKEQQEAEEFIQKKAEHRAQEEELIRAKEKQLKEQEDVLEEEKRDYLAQAKLSKRAEKLNAETEKWRNMKERLSSKEPGVPTDLTDYPACLNKAQKYYSAMKEALRTSRWNSAGLNAINAGIYYADAILIYYYQIKSAYPEHENICRLLAQYVKRADADENIFFLRSMLNVKTIVEKEDRPITRSEALFLAEKTEKFTGWSRSLLP